MSKKVVVFSGGISPERDVSLVSGKYVAEALSKNFDVELIQLDENALPSGINPQDCVVYPAMHGDYGEDGTLQAQLDAAGIEYAGCGSLSSRVCMVKPASKSLLKFAGVKVARAIEFDASQKPSAQTLLDLFPQGCVIKPSDKGSSVGLGLAFDINSAEEALANVKDGAWMAEEFLKGREFSVGVIRGKAAGIVEIKPDGGVYDYKRKYTAGSTKYEFPAKLSDTATQAMRNAAEIAFEACSCRDFARVDFIMTDETSLSIYALEINTLPGMTPTSLLPKSASCIGLSFEELCKTLVEPALERHKQKHPNV